MSGLQEMADFAALCVSRGKMKGCVDFVGGLLTQKGLNSCHRAVTCADRLIKAFRYLRFCTDTPSLTNLVIFGLE